MLLGALFSSPVSAITEPAKSAWTDLIYQARPCVWLPLYARWHALGMSFKPRPLSPQELWETHRYMKTKHAIRALRCVAVGGVGKAF